MKITPEISDLAGKIEIFGNLRYVLSCWIYSGVNKMSVIRTGVYVRKSLFFNVFA